MRVRAGGRHPKKARGGVGVARLSRFYGFPVGRLTPREQIELDAARTVLEAEARLAAGGYAAGRAGDDQFYADVLHSCGTPAGAEAMLYRRIEARVKAL